MHVWPTVGLESYHRWLYNDEMVALGSDQYTKLTVIYSKLIVSLLKTIMEQNGAKKLSVTISTHTHTSGNYYITSSNDLKMSQMHVIDPPLEERRREFE